jgi:hypothetical protein
VVALNTDRLGGMSTPAAGDSRHIQDLEALLGRLEQARERLEHATDAEQAVAALEELDRIAQDVSSEVDRQRRNLADAGVDDGQLGLL